MFAFMAITPSAGEPAQFVATDNVDGYYEGWSYRWRGGVGYRIRDASLLDGFVAAVDGQVLPRDAARCDSIYPYGHQAHHEGARESLLVHTGQRGISLRIDSDTDAILALAPILPLAADGFVISEQDGITLLTPKTGVGSSDWFVAMAASVPVERSMAPLTTALSAQASVPSPVQLSFHTRHPLRQLTLHLSFALSAVDAMAGAQRLLNGDSWQQTRQHHYARLTGAQLWTSDTDYNRALLWASASASSFVVQEFGTGIWAGLPWFRDNWGRDTFIALPGTLLVTGRFADARAVLDNFARYQHRGDLTDPDYGRIPNRVAANSPIIYNTVDGTPWLLRELAEYVRYSGDVEYARTQLPLVRTYLAGVQKHWLDDSGLLTHDDADTWMDARIEGKEAWSPRGNRAVEIQALWFTALQVAAELAEYAGEPMEAVRYHEFAKRVQQQFLRSFWLQGRMADRLSADGHADFSLRPNGLMLVSIPFEPFVAAEIEASIIRYTASRLLLPYGILSLDPSHPDFHPRHVNDAFHHKDAAYHNGTIWGWNAGFMITALNRYGYQDLAWALSRNLSSQILSLGTRGSMSELLDAVPAEDGAIKPSGTYAQSWSVAEFVRNAYQDYLGFRPDLGKQLLRFSPALPTAWAGVSALLPFGQQEQLHVVVKQSTAGTSWRLQKGNRNGAPNRASVTVQMDFLRSDHSRARLSFSLADQPRQLFWDGSIAQLDGKPLQATTVLSSQRAILGDLQFAPVPTYSSDGNSKSPYPVLQGKDVLKQRILSPVPAPTNSHASGK